MWEVLTPVMNLTEPARMSGGATEHESLSLLGKMIPLFQLEQHISHIMHPFLSCFSELAEVIWLPASLWFPGLCVALREGLTIRSLHYAAVLWDPSHWCVGPDNNRVRLAQDIAPFNSLDLPEGCVHPGFEDALGPSAFWSLTPTGFSWAGHHSDTHRDTHTQAFWGGNWDHG